MSGLIGDVNVVNAILFGQPTVSMQQEIAREQEAFVKRIDPVWGSVLLEKTRDLFNSYNGAGVTQMVQNALNNVAAISRPDVVVELRDISEIQTAQSVMQGYMMANPVIRTLYHKGLCDGYSDTYVDPSPGVIGQGHTAYEQVMDGVMVVDDAPESNVVYVNFASAWATEDAKVLDITKQASVLNSWALLEKIAKEGDRDPVSPWNGSL